MRRVPALAILVVCFFLLPRVALAAPPATLATSVAVLSLWTDDADDAADALTQALRAEVRVSPDWSLVDSPDSFETLAIALRCPAKPDAACLQRIGDQLHLSHYVWGTVAKRKDGGVGAEVHIWNRGAPEIDTSGSFSATVKDPNDPALRAVATRMWSELTGAAPTAILVVHAGSAGGVVVIDGDERAMLQSGTVRVPVKAGEHTVAVRVPGFRSAPQTISVAAQSEGNLVFTLTPVAEHLDEVRALPEETRPRRRRIGARSIVGYSAIVVGAGLLVGGAVEAGEWFHDRDANTNDRAHVPNTVPDVCAYSSTAAQNACQEGKDAKTDAVLGWVFAGVGAVLAGTGTWLVLSDSHREASPPERASRRPARPSIEVVPEIGARRQTLALRIAF